jgi:hypothetical protein
MVLSLLLESRVYRPLVDVFLYLGSEMSFAVVTLLKSVVSQPADRYDNCSDGGM